MAQEISRGMSARARRTKSPLGCSYQRLQRLKYIPKMFQIGFKHVAWENAHRDPGDRDATTEKCANAKFPTLGLYIFLGFNGFQQ